MPPFSWIKILDATYRIDGDDAAWLDGVVGTVRPALDHGLGVYAYLYHAPEFRRFRSRPIQFYGCAESTRSMATAALAQTTPEIVRDILLAHPAGTTSEVLGRRRWKQVRDPAVLGDVADSMAVNAVDPSGHGCVVMAPLREMQRMSARDRSLWSKVAAHIASGHRLRRSVRARRVGLLDAAEAIVDRKGRIQHATAPAASEDARAAIRQAATTIDRARLHRKQDPAEVMELWTALTAGRWSLVDHFDSDGQRFFVACRNDPKVSAQRQLSLRERQVATYASFGHSNKHIAYELGISVSTVATHLAAATSKLGLPSRALLIDLVHALAREPAADDES